MAVIRQNTANGGTNGTTVTTGNSGGGSTTAWDLVSIPTGQTLTYSNTQAFDGTLSYKITNDTSTAAGALLRWGDTLALTSAALRVYVYLPGTNPTVAVNLATFSTNNSGTIASSCKLVLMTTGKLQLQDSSSTGIWTSTNVLPTNTWVRLELYATPGATSTSGVVGAGYATGTGALTEQFTSSTVNTGSGPIGRAQFGKTSGTWSGVTFYMDNIALGNTAAFIGTAALSTVTCNAGADQSNIEPWTTVTLSGTDSDSGGTIVTRAWTQTAGTTATLTNANTATATYTCPGTLAGETATFVYTVTDDGAQTASSTTHVSSLPVTERAVLGGVEVPMQIRWV